MKDKKQEPKRQGATTVSQNPVRQAVMINRNGNVIAEGKTAEDALQKKYGKKN